MKKRASRGHLWIVFPIMLSFVLMGCDSATNSVTSDGRCTQSFIDSYNGVVQAKAQVVILADGDRSELALSTYQTAQTACQNFFSSHGNTGTCEAVKRQFETPFSASPSDHRSFCDDVDIRLSTWKSESLKPSVSPPDLSAVEDAEIDLGKAGCDFREWGGQIASLSCDNMKDKDTQIRRIQEFTNAVKPILDHAGLTAGDRETLRLKYNLAVAKIPVLRREKTAAMAKDAAISKLAAKKDAAISKLAVKEEQLRSMGIQFKIQNTPFDRPLVLGGFGRGDKIYGKIIALNPALVDKPPTMEDKVTALEAYSKLAKEVVPHLGPSDEATRTELKGSLATQMATAIWNEHYAEEFEDLAKRFAELGFRSKEHTVGRASFTVWNLKEFSEKYDEKSVEQIWEAIRSYKDKHRIFNSKGYAGRDKHAEFVAGMEKLLRITTKKEELYSDLVKESLAVVRNHLQGLEDQLTMKGIRFTMDTVNEEWILDPKTLKDHLAVHGADLPYGIRFFIVLNDYRNTIRFGAGVVEAAKAGVAEVDDALKALDKEFEEKAKLVQEVGESDLLDERWRLKRKTEPEA